MPGPEDLESLARSRVLRVSAFAEGLGWIFFATGTNAVRTLHTVRDEHTRGAN